MAYTIHVHIPEIYQRAKCSCGMMRHSHTQLIRGYGKLALKSENSWALWHYMETVHPVHRSTCMVETNLEGSLIRSKDCQKSFVGTNVLEYGSNLFEAIQSFLAQEINQSYVMKKWDFLKSRDFRVALLKGLKHVCQYVCMYVCIYLSMHVTLPV